MKFRTYYPKIWQLEILNIFSCSNLRNSMCQEDSDLSLKQMIRPYVRDTPLCPLRKESPYLRRQRITKMNANEQA